MPIYHSLGKIPRKRHTQFRKPDGSLYHEQLFGTIGFDGMSSLLYHLYRPTMVKEVKKLKDNCSKIAIDKNISSLKFISNEVKSSGNFIDSRKILLCNSDINIGVAFPNISTDHLFYKNADADEMLFIQKGSGRLQSMFGEIPFEYGDYLIIPRGTIYNLKFDQTENKILFAESFLPLYTPKRYRNWFGQLLEHSPYCERDYKLPQDLQTFEEKGDFAIKIKKQNTLFEVVYASHPFDVVGWDGYNFPYAISIFDFEPITGRIHQPPPVHQMFETSGFVVCSFVPRLFDYHPESIPAPYNHSNIDSDEVLFYVEGDFMSRNDIAQGHITLHPGGIPHGPHPGTYEASIGKTKTEEYAVMIDTFKPLMITEAAMEVMDDKYITSWL